MSAKKSSFATVTLLLIAQLIVVLTVIPQPAAAAVPDPVLQWMAIMNDTVLTGATSPLVTSRVTALVSVSVFDAVNGIHPAYRPLYVRPNARGNASQRAAAVQAAYVILNAVYPAKRLLSVLNVTRL
jgi:hypothetical protein